MLYRGVGVSVVPYILADIGIKYTCFYMDPLDELVLSALGRVLLATYFPHLVDENLVQAFFSDLESHEEVSELLVFSFDRTLLEDLERTKKFGVDMDHKKSHSELKLRSVYLKR
jgi:hypothetical protein